MHHKDKKHHGKKKTVQTGVRTRIQAEEEFEVSEEQFIDNYERSFAQLTLEQRNEIITRIRAQIRTCGKLGLIKNEAEKEALVTRGLMPYTDPFTLTDGIVPSDSVQIHGQCVSRRSMVQYLGKVGDETSQPSLFDGLSVTAEDMILLDLDANDYRFFNERAPRRRRRLAVESFRPAVVISHDDDDNDDDDEHHSEGELLFMTEEMEEEFREYRTEVYDELQERTTVALIDPATTLEEFEDRMNTRFDLPIEFNRGFHDYVPEDANEYPDTVDFDAHRIDNLLESIVKEYHDSAAGRRFQRRMRRGLAGSIFINKIKYLLREWDFDGKPYFYERKEVDAVVVFALKHKDLQLLQEIEAFVTRMPIDLETPFQEIYTDQMLNVASRQIQNLLDSMRESAFATGAAAAPATSEIITPARSAALIEYGQFSRLVERIKNLQALELEQRRQRIAVPILQRTEEI